MPHLFVNHLVTNFENDYIFLFSLYILSRATYPGAPSYGGVVWTTCLLYKLVHKFTHYQFSVSRLTLVVPGFCSPFYLQIEQEGLGALGLLASYTIHKLTVGHDNIFGLFQKSSALGSFYSESMRKRALKTYKDLKENRMSNRQIVNEFKSLMNEVTYDQKVSNFSCHLRTISQKQSFTLCS